MVRNDLGIEWPDRSSDPLHDHATQVHLFGYFEDILDADDRSSFILGAFNGQYQIPNQRGLQPSGIAGITGLGPDGVLEANGQSAFLSNNINETQHELTQDAVRSCHYAQGVFEWR